ncbi:hypothetical protein PG997_000399 [Apiospora hydei]|uniref:Uncharacterized protein n=1 Tax=Apiospora hydei TaxID=1337664 RepID=A0ABR1XAN3_9PEZI
MAHQAHALPWHTLASLLQYKFSYHIEPQRKDVALKQKEWKNKETEPKEIAYFCRAFCRTAAEADGGQGRPGTRLVYPDAMQNRYFGTQDGSDDDRFRNHFWGRRDLQRVSTWTNPNGSRIEHADTLKLMMMEAAGMPPSLSASPAPETASLQKDVMESMLLLANHPVIGPNLVSLLNLHHGHHFGLIRVAEEGIKSYVYLNLLVAMQENGSGVCDPAKDEKGFDIPDRKNYMNLFSFERMLRSVAGNYDGDAQNLPHWDFYYPRDELSWDDKNTKDVVADRGGFGRISERRLAGAGHLRSCTHGGRG